MVVIFCKHCGHKIKIKIWQWFLQNTLLALKKRDVTYESGESILENS